MIYYYHPILGLQYYTFENEMFLIELPAVEVTAELISEWKDLIHRMGVMVIDSTKSSIEQLYLPIYSNF